MSEQRIADGLPYYFINQQFLRYILLSPLKQDYLHMQKSESAINLIRNRINEFEEKVHIPSSDLKISINENSKINLKPK